MIFGINLVQLISFVLLLQLNKPYEAKQKGQTQNIQILTDSEEGLKRFWT